MKEKIVNGLKWIGLFLALLVMGLLNLRSRVVLIIIAVVLTVIAVAVGSQVMEKWDLGFWY